MRYLAALLLVVLAIAVALPAEAAYCQSFQGQDVCIRWIKRSAKNYWEYRAAVSVNGKGQPVQVYDCRSRVIVDRDGTIFSFSRNDPGEVVCSLFKQRSKSLHLSDLTTPQPSSHGAAKIPDFP
jgi:hypothetical protein